MFCYRKQLNEQRTQLLKLQDETALLEHEVEQLEQQLCGLRGAVAQLQAVAQAQQTAPKGHKPLPAQWDELLSYTGKS